MTGKIKWMQHESGSLRLNLIHVFFFVVFGSLSILNHYYFRSAGLDYGLANQALYQYAHRQSAMSTLLVGSPEMPYPAIHLSLWVPLVSPLYYVFGSYTLLIFQNIMLVSCGIGLVRLAKEMDMKEGGISLLLLQFYGSFTIYSALAFDYHDNVVGACFVPWLFYAWKKENRLSVFLFFVAILISKENMAIWLGFLLLGLWWLNTPMQFRKLGLPFSLISVAVVWFLLAGLWIMPMLNPTGRFEQLSRFSHLGHTLPEIIRYIFFHPVEMVKLFYQSHIQPDAEEIVKQEFLLALLLSGGLALLFRPAFLFMALPILMQKLWNKELAFWGVSFHYQVELAPLMSIAIMYGLTHFRQPLLRAGILSLLAISTIATTVYLMHQRKAFYDPVKENMFLSEHYKRPFDVDAVKVKLNSIPREEKVCAQSNLLPHLMEHRYLYHFPYVKDADRIVYLNPHFNSYPLSDADAMLFIDSLRACNNWVVDSTTSPLYILTKKTH